MSFNFGICFSSTLGLNAIFMDYIYTVYTVVLDFRAIRFGIRITVYIHLEILAEIK